MASKNELGEFEKELRIRARKLDHSDLKKLIAQAKALAEFEDREFFGKKLDAF